MGPDRCPGSLRHYLIASTDKAGWMGEKLSGGFQKGWVLSPWLDMDEVSAVVSTNGSPKGSEGFCAQKASVFTRYTSIHYGPSPYSSTLWGHLDRPPVPSSFAVRRCCRCLPRQAFSIITSSRSIEQIVLPLYCFFNPTLSSLDIISSIETFLPIAVVTPTVFRSAGRAGVSCSSSGLRDAVVEQYNGSEEPSILGG